MPVPAENPLTDEKIEIGQRLFFDRRLSADGRIACASCHQPARAFSDPRRVSIGVYGRMGVRNAPVLVNRGYGKTFSWDGRAASLETQVLQPIEDPREMGSSVVGAAARVSMRPSDMADALASYVRSLLSGDSLLDRYTAGDRSALTVEQRVGLQLFRGKGNCATCHVGPNFTDEAFHNTGVTAAAGRVVDDGRFGVSGREEDRGAFKTPTLRDVARSAPYMHDGSMATLEEVVDFYDGGGRPNAGLDGEIRRLGLTAGERLALVSFLRSLTGAPATSGARSLPSRSPRPGATPFGSSSCRRRSRRPGRRGRYRSRAP